MVNMELVVEIQLWIKQHKRSKGFCLSIPMLEQHFDIIICKYDGLTCAAKPFYGRLDREIIFPVFCNNISQRSKYIV